MTSQGYPDGSQVDYWYDAENQIVQVQDFDGGVTLFEYDPNGNKIYKEYPNNESAYYSIVAYKTGTEQSVNLVLDTIHQAIRREKKKAAADLHLHSDQGAQYASHAYFELTQQYGITPSMSRRGNPYNNAMAENFFSILKTECIYRHKPATLSEANEMIDRYIHFYNHERIQSKTGVAPLTLRHSC